MNRSKLQGLVSIRVIRHYLIRDFKLLPTLALETTDLLRSDKRVYQLRKSTTGLVGRRRAPVAVLTFARRKLQVRLT